MAVFLVSVLTTACATSVTHVTVHYAKSYSSIDALLADTKLLVVATARSVTPDHSAPDSRPRSLVAMKVDEVVRGSAGSRIVVSEVGGQPGVVVDGQVPIIVGHTYLLCLGVNQPTGRFYVLNGITGLFAYDSESQTATRLDPKATWLPQSFPLWLVRSDLEMLARNGLGPEPTPTSPTTSTTTTTAPPIPGACPPGCRYPSDYDAITVLASSAWLVAIVTVNDVQKATSTGGTEIEIDKVLQGDSSDASVGQGLSRWLGGGTNQSDLVFMSFNRGGPCLSATFSYNPATQIATFLGSNDGQANRVPLLSGRVVLVPHTMTLAYVQARMYPTGGVVYPIGTEEWDCPGP
jgi:hypothetical protein